jgi:hypothetical protein
MMQRPSAGDNSWHYPVRMQGDGLGSAMSAESGALGLVRFRAVARNSSHA